MLWSRLTSTFEERGAAALGAAARAKREAMGPEEHTLAVLLAFSGAGLALKLLTSAVPRAGFDLAKLLLLVLCAACALALGYGLGAALTRSSR